MSKRIFSIQVFIIAPKFEVMLFFWLPVKSILKKSSFSSLYVANEHSPCDSFPHHCINHKTLWEEGNNRVNQKFCSILVMLATVWLLQMLLPRLENDEPHRTVRCQAHLIFSECYSLDFPLWLELNLGIHGFRSTWPCLIVKVLRPEPNFLNHLVIVLWSTAPSLCVQQMFLVASVTAN